jgi:hypothetical protein
MTMWRARRRQAAHYVSASRKVSWEKHREIEHPALSTTPAVLMRHGGSLLSCSGGRLALRIVATFIFGISGRRGKVSALSLAHELDLRCFFKRVFR